MAIETKTLQEKLVLGHVALFNVSDNLCCNSTTKLRDKLQGKLPSVTVLLGYLGTLIHIVFLHSKPRPQLLKERITLSIGQVAIQRSKCTPVV